MKAKVLNIATGGPLVVLLHKKDAERLSFHTGDRIMVVKNKKEVTAIIDIATKGVVKKGVIGLFKETAKSLGVKKDCTVKVFPGEKPESVLYIKEKLDGKTLSKEKIQRIIEDISTHKLSDVEITYFVAACYSGRMSLKETVYLTEAMVNTGDVLKIKTKNGIIADKHCIGGVAGNRTTMLLVPIISSLGVIIPKTSSRAITSPAGTADTMEVLCNVNFPMKQLYKLVEKEGAFITWGGAVNLAPADDKIIRVENPLSIDSEGQLLASILAKKKSVSATHVLIDIPVGKGAKIESLREAKHLKKRFEIVSRLISMKTRVIITDGSQPIGRGIGPALEARDVLWVLEQDERAPKDLEKKALFMSAELLRLTTKIKFKEALKKAEESLRSGRALDKMIRIIKNQGPKVTESSEIKLGKYKAVVKARKSGKITWINNKRVSLIARVAGAPLDKKAGIYLEKKKGDYVNHHSILYIIYAENKQKLEYALRLAEEDPGFEIR